MKRYKTSNALIQNDRFLLIISFFLAICVWVAVVVLASPQTTRKIKNVPVSIDKTVISQFGLQVFGEEEFQVDVEVKGKKYLISSANLTIDDVNVEAITAGVNSAGYYTLQLRAANNDNNDFVVTDISPKTIRVYFDTEKSADFAVQAKIDANGFPVVKKGYTYGDATVSEPTVTITGPSTQVNRVKSVVASLELEKSLDANASSEVELVAVDDAGKTVSDYITLSVTKTLVNIPVFRVKKVNSIVTFKNVPTELVENPLRYTITPNVTAFNVIVDDYEKTTESSVGVVDYNLLSPTNNIFKFDVANTLASNPDFKEFTVTVDMKDYSQEYIKVTKDNIQINNPNKLDVSVSGLDKSVAIVGKTDDLMQITEDMIKVDLDLSLVDIEKGETVSIPVVVSVDSPNCWVYGAYTVRVRLN